MHSSGNQPSNAPSPPASRLRTIRDRLREHPLARVGPGLITGVADDDPSGIATYSQAGAQFGLNMLWTMPLAFPLMATVQSMCARIGRVTGKGLSANIKSAFPPIVLQGVVLLLLIANTLNIAADVAAMGEVGELVSGVNRHLMTVFFVFGTLLLQVLVPYHRYVFYLKWLTISLLAYAAVLFTVHVPWGEVALRTVWPQLTLDSGTAAVVVGVFGTTISPYLFFWQASEEVEDMQAKKGSVPLVRDEAGAAGELRRIRWDTWSGMFYSDIAAYFIILATAVTLHVAGVTDVDTAAKAASALRPIAGNFAYIVLCFRHLRRRTHRSASACGFSRLRPCRSDGLEMAIRTQSVRRSGLLWRHRLQCPLRTFHSVFADQPHESALLERGDQWNRGCAVDDRDHRSGLQENGDGRIHSQPAGRNPRLDRHGRHGPRGGAHAHPRVIDRQSEMSPFRVS
jgi:Mn2+/Fe2+ NRAMP family transporter